MADIPKTALEMQIEQEAKELKEVPKIPVQRFFGSHARCHFCGQVHDPEEGKMVGGRRMCPNCGGKNG
jgi:formylmethanofuran dehydrogenase subunit E